MVSTTPSCTSHADARAGYQSPHSRSVRLSSGYARLGRCLLIVALSLWLGTASLSAAEVEVHQPTLIAADDGYVLSADFTFELPARLEEAVTRGVVLPFVIEFEVTRRRWWWLDESVISRSQTIRLSYHALTRQYRLSVGALHQAFPSLAEALRLLARLRHWSRRIKEN